MNTSTRDSERWLHRLRQDAPATRRLVCFPHAGGAAGFYAPLARALAPDTEVLAVQYPGRQERHREAPIEDIAVLADAVTDALRDGIGRPADDVPTAFFGHSMGAVVAFEVVRRLEAARAPGAPALLFASGRRAPSRLRPDTVHQRDDEGVLDELRRLDGTDARVLADDELVRLILPAVRGDYRAIETYRCPPGPPLRCAVTVLVGADDPRVTPDEARDWRQHTIGAFDLQVFPGGHFYLGAQRQAVAAAVTAGLAALG